MALVSLVQSALPGSAFFSGQTVNFGVPWTALTVSLNVLLTAVITYRILRLRTKLSQSGQYETFSIYTGFAAIFVESALPFSILGIVYAVTYGREVDEAPFFSFVWGTLVVRIAGTVAISSELIVSTGTGSANHYLSYCRRLLFH